MRYVLQKDLSPFALSPFEPLLELSARGPSLPQVPWGAPSPLPPLQRLVLSLDRRPILPDVSAF